MAEQPTRERPSILPPLLAILFAAIGTSLMAWTFGRIVDLALGGGGTLPFQVLFFVGAGLDVAALAIAITALVRGRRRGLAGIALAFALVPVVLVVLLAIAANAGGGARPAL